ncbi:putative Ig domain-containing protein [Rhizobium sp. S95]|uniref:Ig domain-containing protein n=1 Tax=Ciceribacter sichuanensis TaxID=2949647 RepID=A0AAJ1F6U0_9HYPH|nr:MULTISPECIES: putative Ig domain-containing protein [unclassified Ciceribacter]MCM2397654.1 putative Ig domain-containing protein [Ciceribacter sp. S95]MCO5956303.1 putative Ig domain-containing protein [Ciceribacter sp. S101]
MSNTIIHLLRRLVVNALATLALIICLSQTSAKATDLYHEVYSGESVRLVVNAYGQNAVGYDYPNGLHGTATGAPDGTADLIYTSNAGYVGQEVIVTTAYGGANYEIPVASDTHHITVKPRITFSASSWPNGKKGAVYSQSVTASYSASSTAVTYSLADGSLPTGLSLDGSTGTISGTPTTTGSWTFTYRAVNGDGYSSSQSMTLKIAPSATDLSTTVAANSSGNTIAFAVSGSEQVSAVSAPSHGSTGLSGSTATYTPTAGYSGSDSFTYLVTDSATGLSSAATVTITVTAPTVAISPSTLPAGTAAVAYSQTLSGNNGTAPYAFVVTSGSLPAGLTLATNGTLSGIPTSEESQTFTVTATDHYGATGSQSYTVAIAIAAPVAGDTSATIAANSGSNAIALNLSGGAASTVTVETAAAHGTATASGAAISYTPTPGYSGSDSFTYTATNATGTSTAATVTITVTAPTVAISPSTLPAGTAAVAYSQTLSAANGTAPYIFAVTSGSLPAGLTLSTGGTLSGTPTTEETRTFTITVTDFHGATGNQSYTVAIAIAAPVASDTSTTVAANSNDNPVALNLSGGAASTVAIANAPGHGNATVSGAAITYTPTPGYSGSDSFTYTATNASGTSTAATVSVTVTAPTVAILPSSLPRGTAAVAYSQSITANNGTAPYTFAVTSGSLPAGLTLATDGKLAGTPTAEGSQTFTVTATDAYGATGSQSYTVAIAVAAPLAADVSATVAANSSNNAITLNLSGGAVSTVAIETAPGHGTATASGASIAYTPTAGYSGSDSFTYIATNASGTSAAAAVTITVTAPTLALSPTGHFTLRENETFSQTFTASNGGAPYSYAITGSLPAGISFNAASATLSGNPTVSGEFPLTLTVTDTYGATTSASVILAIGDALPVAPSMSSVTTSGLTTTVDLTEGATGGPFTGADLVSLSPPSAGTATIILGDTAAVDSSAAIASAIREGRYRLRFTASPTFSGNAVATYTLTSATGVSAPATVTFSVTARPDLSADADLAGLVKAQAEAAKRLADSQIDNVQQHLKSLRGRQCLENSLGISLTDTADGQAPISGSAGCSPIAGGDLAFWSGGSIDLGDTSGRDGASDIDHTTVSLTAGLDYRLTDTFIGGVAIGFSRDRSDIGDKGTTSVNKAASATLYGLYQPGGGFFIDGLLGAGILDFDSLRITSVTGQEAEANRSGRQFYAAVTGGYDYRIGEVSLSSYGRLSGSRSILDSVEESGTEWENALIGRQQADSFTATLGLSLGYDIDLESAVLTPELTLDFSHDFLSSSDTTVTYADSGWPIDYVIPGSDSSRDRLTVGFGLTLVASEAGTMTGRYSATLDRDGLQSQRFNVDLSRKF